MAFCKRRSHSDSRALKRSAATWSTRSPATSRYFANALTNSSLISGMRGLPPFKRAVAYTWRTMLSTSGEVRNPSSLDLSASVLANSAETFAAAAGKRLAWALAEACVGIAAIAFPPRYARSVQRPFEAAPVRRSCTILESMPAAMWARPHNYTPARRESPFRSACAAFSWSGGLWGHATQPPTHGMLRIPRQDSLAAGSSGARARRLPTAASALRLRLRRERPVRPAVPYCSHCSVNDEDVRYLGKDATATKDGDTISLVPSIAGGSAVASPPEEATVLSNEEILRYSRHLIIPEVGMEGQQKLKAAKVLLIGAGGLGAPLGLYLAAAGVGRIGIVDFDVVDSTNLQRQVIHTTADVGRKKIDSAAEKMRAINPNVNVIKHETALTSENALEILKDYDLVVDGTDNFPTRYLVNDACVLLGKPNV